MSITNYVSKRLLSTKLLIGAKVYQYEGVTDFVGGRLLGQYMDGLSAGYNNVVCNNTTAESVTCCGDYGPPYYDPKTCNYYYLSVSNTSAESIPSSSFSPSPSGGYYDPTTKKGFKTIGFCGAAVGKQHSTEYLTCTNCAGNDNESYIFANGGTSFFGTNAVAGIDARDDTLYTWGYNAYGQLGNNSTVNSVTPIQLGYDKWKVVRGSGGSFFAAIKNDGTLWTWGDNSYGQLGDGTTTSRSSPVQVPGSWKFISVGNQTVMGIRDNDTLWGWGRNDSVPIGNNSGANRSSPVQVYSAGTWKYVHTNGLNTHAIRSDGRAFGWGTFTYSGATLGNGVATDSPVPIEVSGGYTDWVEIFAPGRDWRVGVRANGTAWVWGESPFGVSSGLKQVPTQIGTATDHSTGSCIQATKGGICLGAGGRELMFILNNGNVISYRGYNSTRTTLYGSGSAAQIIAGWNQDEIAEHSGVYLIKNVPFITT